MKFKNSLLSKIFILLIGYFCFFNGNFALAYSQESINYNNMGITHTKKGNYDQAISCFKKAIDADSSLTNAYYNLGSVYKYTGNPDKALKAFNLLLRNSPDDDEAAYLIAGLYYDKQDYEKSLIYLNSIETNSPSYKEAMELFKKINKKINDSVIAEIKEPEKSKENTEVKEVKQIKETQKPIEIKEVKEVKTPQKPAPINSSKYTFIGFSGPTGIAEDSHGNLYIANYCSDSIYIFSSDGKPKSVISDTLIKGPVGIAIDSKDNIYVANYALNNVVQINKTGIIRVILNNIVKPYYLYLNKSGVLYVSEQDKNTVTRVGIPE